MLSLSKFFTTRVGFLLSYILGKNKIMLLHGGVGLGILSFFCYSEYICFGWSTRKGFGVGLLLHERRETRASIRDSPANSIVI